MRHIRIAVLVFAFISVSSALAQTPQTDGSNVRNEQSVLDIWVMHTHNNASGDQPNLEFSGDVKTDSVFMQLRKERWTSGLALARSVSSFKTPSTKGEREESFVSAVPYVLWQVTPFVVLNGYVGMGEGTSETLQSPMGPVEGSRDFKTIMWGLGASLKLTVGRGMFTPTLQYAHSDARYEAYNETRTFDEGNVTRFPRDSDRIKTGTLGYGVRYDTGFGRWMPHAGITRYNRATTNISGEAKHWLQSTVGLRYLLSQSAQVGIEHKGLHRHEWEKGSAWILSANYSW